jgi:beta-galactosidase
MWVPSCAQATGYPYDLPLRSYDFQAPLGEFGQAHPSFGVLKLFHLFLNDFGAELTPMTPYFPEHVPSSLHDTSTPRVSARMQGDHGFIFITIITSATILFPSRRTFRCI